MTSQQRSSGASATVEDLIVELVRHTACQRIGQVLWPGVTVHSFRGPADVPRIDKAGTVAIAIVAQGGVAAVVSGTRQGLQDQIARSQPDQASFCLILQVDPRLIRRVWEAIAPYRLRRAAGEGESTGDARTDVDDELLETTVRFLRALTSESDRRVLAPLYMEEIAYRVLQSDHGPQVLGLATPEERGPIADTLDFIANNLGESLTVAELARRVHLSASSLSRAFRETTGSSPYQYVKEARLVRARELLCGGRDGIGSVAHHVGYVSSSHFIKEFRNRFGTTPGDFLDTCREDRSRRTSAVGSAFAAHSALRTDAPARPHDRDIDLIASTG